MNMVVSWQIGKGYSNLVLKSLQLDALFGLVFDWYGVLPTVERFEGLR